LTSYTLSGGMQVFCYPLQDVNGVSRLKVQGRLQALLYDAQSKKTLAVAYPGQFLSIGRKGKKHQMQLWFLPWSQAYPLADEKRGINTPLDYFMFDGALLIKKLNNPNVVETLIKKAAALALAQPPEESLEQVCKLLEPLGLCAWHWPGEKDT